MKKFFMLLAAAVFAFAACQEKEGPASGDGGSGTGGDSNELYLSYKVQLQHEITTTYGGAVVTVEGQKILDFFGMTADEFYLAMGSLEDGGQVNNTLMFGLCYKDGDEWVYTFTPSTTNNFGHYMTREGLMTTWASEAADAYMYTESNGWWGYESLDAAVEDGMASRETIWDFSFGIRPDYYDGQVGDKHTATEFIFEESTGKTLYITWNLEIVDYIDPELGNYPSEPTAGTFPIDVPLTFSLAAQEYEYEGAFFEEPFETIKEKFGKTAYELSKAITAGEITLTYTLPDGTTGEGTNVWLNANNGLTSWGAEDAAVCIEWFAGSTPDDLYGHTCAMPSYYDPAPESGLPYYYGDAVMAAVGKPLSAKFTIAGGETTVELNVTTTLAE